jgi:hypothetical protein
VVTSAGGDKAWVDLPAPGPEAFLEDYATAGGLVRGPTASCIVFLGVGIWHVFVCACGMVAKVVKIG